MSIQGQWHCSNYCGRCINFMHNKAFIYPIENKENIRWSTSTILHFFFLKCPHSAILQNCSFLVRVKIFWFHRDLHSLRITDNPLLTRREQSDAQTHHQLLCLTDQQLTYLCLQNPFEFLDKMRWVVLLFCFSGSAFYYCYIQKEFISAQCL